MIIDNINQSTAYKYEKLIFQNLEKETDSIHSFSTVKEIK